MRALKATLKAIPGAGIKLYAAAAWQEMNNIKNVSMERTPVMNGPLRASHVIIGPTFDQNSAEVSVGVGGPSAPYAVVVHEDLSVHHPGPHAPKRGQKGDRYCGGQSKFLESAFNDAAPGSSVRMAARVGAAQIAEAARRG
jgi:hypothetical protein